MLPFLSVYITVKQTFLWRRGLKEWKEQHFYFWEDYITNFPLQSDTFLNTARQLEISHLIKIPGRLLYWSCIHLGITYIWYIWYIWYAWCTYTYRCADLGKTEVPFFIWQRITLINIYEQLILKAKISKK